MTSPLLIKDANWVRQSFLVKSADLDNAAKSYRTWTSASLKFTDTSLGGNFAINPPPSFTRTADLKANTRLAGGTGMGRYYSEAIDDNSQVIYMRFGVPAFNSLTTFFTGFYNTGAGKLARTGRATGVFYNLGKAAGFVVAVMNWQLLAIHLLGVGAKFFLDKPSSKFYYLKPTMPLYWNAVQTMVNQIAVNRGIVPRIGSGATTANKTDLSDEYQWDDQARALFHSKSPDLFNANGSIDVYAMATRSMRLQHKQMMRLKDALSDGEKDLTTGIQEVMSESYSDGDSMGYLNYLAKFAGDSQGSGATSQAQPNPADTKDQYDTDSEAALNSTTADDGFLSFMEAELNDGGAFAGFRVNATGAVGESFSNSVTESEIANKINSMSSSSRSTKFDLAGGNLGDGPIAGAVKSILGAAGDVVAGAADSLGVSGLAALAGAAFVDIPKHWESSTASLPRAQYTINLVSPYGNPMSQLMNIHIPLCMLLAAALPISTGKQSYTSPFICEIYDKGRCQIRLGIVDSLSITRGTGNLGFTNEGHVMAVDVSFSVLDLSSVMHMPISQGINMAATLVGATAGAAAGGLLGAGLGAAAVTLAAPTFDDDTVYSDYMALLGGMGLADQIYSWRKYKLNLTRQMTNWNSWFSSSHFASWLGNTPPARLLSMRFKGLGDR